MTQDDRKKIVSIYRNICGMTRKDFAKKIGYSETYLRLIDVGEVDVTDRFIKNFSEATNLNDTDMMRLIALHTQATKIIAGEKGV